MSTQAIINSQARILKSFHANITHNSNNNYCLYLIVQLQILSEFKIYNL